VLGNGDIWEADDALRMVRETGLRRCGDRPGVPGPAVAVRRPGRRLRGTPERRLPGLLEVAATMRRHAELLAEWLGEDHGLRDFRKHVAWYLKGFGVGGDLRAALASVSSLAELDDLLGKLDVDQPFPLDVLGRPAVAPAAPGRWPCPRAGWRRAMSALCPRTAELAIRAADVRHMVSRIAVTAPTGAYPQGNVSSDGIGAVMPKYVYDFSEGNKDLKDLLGGKGANLAR